MEKQNTQNLAEKIALLLQNETPAIDLNSLQLSLERINQRLDQIESSIAFSNPNTENYTPKSNHFSQEKFTHLEDIADEIINNLQNEKACPYEPTGKPCDHCAMCNSRGF